ncbi:MAG: PAS domain S-box protein [Phycisphaerae bacterium]|nr:PAS domain S-box protein [Phycisphaerae bacterium]
MKQSIREPTLLWAGVVTALAVVAYRLHGVFDGGLAANVTPRAVSPIVEWTVNACVFFSLAIFLVTWIQWRSEQKRRGELQSILASVAPDVLLVVEPDRTIRLCNPAVTEMFGHPVRDVIGARTEKLYGDRREPDEKLSVRDSLERHGFHIGTARGVTRDGRTLPLEIVTGKLAGRRGAVVLLRDTTERVRLERMREDLSHMIVHDLKSPLAAVSLAASTVRTMAAERLDEREKSHLDSIVSTCLQLADMVVSLLDIRRLQERKMPLHPERCDMQTVIEKAANSVGRKLEDRGIVLSLPEEPIEAWCDCDVVRRVAANMIGNAVKFSPDGGTVRVAAVAEGGGVRVAVADEGPGIPLDLQDRIFEQFAQLDARRHSTGLGLTFCKLAVEAHGGRIGVESREGAGSTFWFTLPGRPGTDPRG